MNRQMGIIMVLLFTVFVGFGIIIPIMPEILETYHMALMLAIYSAVTFIMSPVWGAISDRIGRRPVILIGIFGFSVSFFIFGYGIDSLTLMYVSRVMGGFFSGAVMSCAVAYVADITTEDERTKGMGLVGMSIGLGFIFGPAIGGLLSDVGGPLSALGYKVPFYASSLLALLTFVFVGLYLQESLPISARRGRQQKQPSRWTAFAGAMKYLYVLGFFVSFTLAGLEATLQYFLMVKIGITPSGMGMMFLVSGMIGAAVQGGVVRKYIKRGAEYRAVQIGLLLSALGFFAILLSDQLWTATAYLCIFTVGNSLVRPCVLSLITQKTKVSHGLATGLSSSMDSLGRIFGPLLGAAVYYLHITLPFIIGGFLCLGAITLINRFKTLLEKGGSGQVI